MATLIGALLIGATLGLLGSGGSAITVPILVYLIGHDAKISIAESMAIVGLISLVGAIPKAAARHVDWKSVIWFGLPAMLGTYIGAWLGGLASDALQLTVFGVVVILAAALMLRNAFGARANDSDSQPQERRAHDWLCILKITCEGVLVGALTGFVGVGGGFLIVPALLMLERLPIRTAIGTSLVIIAMKSAIGFGKYQYILGSQGLSVDFQTIVAFALIGVAGCAVGQKLNTRMNQLSLKKVFAVFLVLIGVYVIFHEGGKLVGHPVNQPATQSINTIDDRQPCGHPTSTQTPPTLENQRQQTIDLLTRDLTTRKRTAGAFHENF